MDISVSNLGPVSHIRDALPINLHSILRQVLGTLSVPPDTPNPAKVIVTLGRAVRLYRRTLGPLRPAYNDLFIQLEALASAVDGLSIFDHTPSTQLVGRTSEYAAWKFLMMSDGNHDRLLIPAGAETVFALVHQQRSGNEQFCALLKDIQKISHSTAANPIQEEDLAQLHFGAAWYGRYCRIDQKLRKLMLLPSPPGTDRYEGEDRAHQRLHNAIVQRSVFPQRKHKLGVSNHRHLSKSQFRSVLATIRQQTDEGACIALLDALQILTGLPSETVLQIPLSSQPSLQWCGRINIIDGVLELNLDAIFPGRRKSPLTSQQNFLPASSIVRSPLPDFVHRALLSHLEKQPLSRCVGDLLDWPGDAGARCLLPDQEAPILQTISRARASLALDAMATGVSRSLVAAMTWDFGIVPTARSYYLRLDSQAVRVQWCEYLDAAGWVVTEAVQARLEPFGASCVLSVQGVQKVFGRFTQLVQTGSPGRNGSLDRAVGHHNLYANYVGAVLSFCCGLRQRTVYEINARSWQPGLGLALVNDKRSSRSDFDRPVILSGFAQQVLRDWQAHCAALHGRIERSDDAPTWKAVTQHLTAISLHQCVPLVFHIECKRPRPIGHSDVWGTLPPTLATPANAGRSFWLSHFQDRGCSTFLLDAFMRHSTQGLELETTSRSVPLAAALSELIHIQDSAIAEMKLPYVRGLRSAT